MRIFINFRSTITDPVIASRFKALFLSSKAFDAVILSPDYQGPDPSSALRAAGVIGQCDGFVALIGPYWADARDAQGFLIEDVRDPIRAEIIAALDRIMPMVPVLLDGAGLPHASQITSALQGLALRDHIEMDTASLDQQFSRLMAMIAPHAGPDPSEKPYSSPPSTPNQSRPALRRKVKSGVAAATSRPIFAWDGRSTDAAKREAVAASGILRPFFPARHKASASPVAALIEEPDEKQQHTRLELGADLAPSAASNATIVTGFRISWDSPGHGAPLPVPDWTTSGSGAAIQFPVRTHASNAEASPATARADRTPLAPEENVPSGRVSRSAAHDLQNTPQWDSGREQPVEGNSSDIRPIAASDGAPADRPNPRTTASPLCRPPQHERGISKQPPKVGFVASVVGTIAVALLSAWGICSLVNQSLPALTQLLKNLQHTSSGE